MTIRAMPWPLFALAALFLGALPALMAVRRSLADGLSIRT